ncbi:MAG: MFS transporter [Frankiales bacterium]|nr:MFS transporter [Frankiales bacterium]
MTDADPSRAGSPGPAPAEPAVVDPAVPPSGGLATTSTFASLAVPNYRRFFLGQAVSLTGTWMQSVALAWLVLQLTGSATWVGLAVALQTLPVLLLGPYAGVLVDRVDKRRLLLGTQSAAAAQALLIGVLTVRGDVTMAWVLALSLVLGLVNTLDNPGRQSFVREMVTGPLVRNAVTLNSVVVNASRAVGPAVGGLLIARYGVGVCFLINAASFLAVIGAYLTMDVAQLGRATPAPRAPRQLRDGLSYVRRTPDLFVPLLMMALVGTLTYEFSVSLPALATDTFGEGAAALGAITSAMGVGAVLGGLASASRSATGIRPLAVSATAFGVATACTALSPTVQVAGASLLLVGAASVWFLSVGNATLQLTAAPQMRGRVMALWAVAFLGSTPLGGPLVGWVSEHLSPRWGLGLGAAAALGAAGIGAWALRSHAAHAVPQPEAG